VRGSASVSSTSFGIAAGVLMALAVAMVLAGFIPRRLQARQRDTGYGAYCAARGYHYTADRPGAEAANAKVAGFFSQGVYRYWRYEIAGTADGVAFVVFEYAYIDQPRHARTFVYAVMKWDLAEKLPPFDLLPAKVFYETAGGNPAPRIEFPDDPFFTETYACLATDPDAVHA
jgi:hypothetical protein